MGISVHNLVLGHGRGIYTPQTWEDRPIIGTQQGAMCVCVCVYVCDYSQNARGQPVQISQMQAHRPARTWTLSASDRLKQRRAQSGTTQGLLE